MSNQKTAVIFANGEIDHQVLSARHIHPGDLIIAADGGARNCQKLGLTPDVLIGDFDSLEACELRQFEQAGSKIIRHPARKDNTDLELALLYAKSIGITQVLIFGALGLRWDQTLANLLLPASKELAKMSIRLVDGNQEIAVVHAGDQYKIVGKPGDTVSIIPLDAETSGITTEGLEYPLENDSLAFGGTRGISNVLVGERGSVHLLKGTLLCVVIRQR